MKSPKNLTEVKLQSQIEAQEHALTALLERVMHSPLAPVRTTLDDLQNRLKTIEADNAKRIQGIGVMVSDELNGIKGSVKNGIGGVEADIADLRQALTEVAAALQLHQSSQAGRDQHLADRLNKAADLLAGLEAKVDKTGAELAGITREVTKLDDALGKLREHARDGTENLNHSLIELGRRLEQQQTHVNAGFDNTGTLLAQLSVKAGATGETVTAVARGINQLNTELDTMQQQDKAGNDLLNIELSGLAQRLECLQTALAEHIDSVQPALAPRFVALTEAIEESSKAVGRSYATLSAKQEELMKATFQEQIALQLAPLQVRIKWLLAVVGVSLASTIGLLGMLFLR